MPRRPRCHSVGRKRQVLAEYNDWETLHGLTKRNGVSCTLIRVWIAKDEAGEFNDDVVAVELLATYQVCIAALERFVGKKALEQASSKGGLLRPSCRQACIPP